jgi:hypothetical protein
MGRAWGENKATTATGYVMGRTTHHIRAALEEKQALAAIRPLTRLPEKVFDKIWVRRSAAVTRNALLTGRGVGTYGVHPDKNPVMNKVKKGTLGSDERPPVQWRVERRSLRRWGTISGGLMVASGLMSIVGGFRSDNRLVGAVAMLGGTAEAASGGIYAYAALKQSNLISSVIDKYAKAGTYRDESLRLAGLMEKSGRYARLGGGVATAALSGYALYGDIQRGDLAAGIGDGLSLGSAGFTIAAGLGAESAIVAWGGPLSAAAAGGYAAGTIINEYVLPEETKSLIGETLVEFVDHGLTDAWDFYVPNCVKRRF